MPRRTHTSRSSSPQYQSANPGVTINYEPAADNNTYEDKVLTALASGGGPDIFNEGLSSMYTFAGLGQLAEITPQVLKAMGYSSLAAFKNDYIPGIIDKLLYGGKLYSVYREFNIFGLMLNKSSFKRAGLDATKDYPKTWGDMLVLAKRLTMWDGDKLVQTGMYLPQWGADWTFIPMQSLFLQNGASVLDSSGKASAITSDASMKTFAYFRSLARAEDNAPIKFADDVWARFALGDVAMYVASTWTMPLLKDQAKGDARFSPANFVVVPYPKVPGASRVHNPIQALVWSVNAKSDNVAAAWKFVQWMTSGTAGNRLVQRRRLSSPDEGNDGHGEEGCRRGEVHGPGQGRGRSLCQPEVQRDRGRGVQRLAGVPHHGQRPGWHP